MMEDMSVKIVDFFREFSHIDVEVLDIKQEPDGYRALCRMTDGEYQVILDNEFSVKAYYRKKLYKDNRPGGVDKLSSIPQAASITQFQQNPETTGICEDADGQDAVVNVRAIKKPLLSNSEKAVAIMIKKQPGITSFDISREMNLKFKILSPILKKLLSEGIIKREGEKFY
ncbi:MAG TPA: hypothetical protein GXX35_12255 [Thermoanaerobacterales bacterium]|nr:hypothetical protein [Thermoanaerobacterales bacterium]